MVANRNVWLCLKQGTASMQNSRLPCVTDSATRHESSFSGSGGFRLPSDLI
jgi:hypothetical protein